MRILQRKFDVFLAFFDVFLEKLQEKFNFLRKQEPFSQEIDNSTSVGVRGRWPPGCYAFLKFKNEISIRKTNKNEVLAKYFEVFVENSQEKFNFFPCADRLLQRKNHILALQGARRRLPPGWYAFFNFKIGISITKMFQLCKIKGKYLRKIKGKLKVKGKYFGMS